MPRFDAELYLRLLGETQVHEIDPGQGIGSSPLDEAAGALVAAGAIARTTARRVTDDYQRAQALRSEQGHHFMSMRRMRSQRGRARPLRFRRVAPVYGVIETAEGSLEIRSVSFGDGGTSLAVVFTGRAQRQGRRSFMFGGHQGLPWGSAAPQLTDDQGTSTTLSFSGSWGGGESTGRLSSDDVLSSTTRWLDYDGTRLTLDLEPASAEVSIEELEPVEPAVRHLWRRISISEHGPAPEIQPAIDALVAAGTLSAEDPVIAALTAVRERLPHHPGMRRHGAPSGTRTLPEPWRSLLRRIQKEDGPLGGMVLGAATPLFDGHRVGVLSIDSDASGFTAEVEVSPGDVGMRMRFGGISTDQLVWWARDDRGNHYLGSVGGWSGGGDHASGQINFWPALDPKAQRLELLPTAEAERAVIAFPLHWHRREEP
jgi:hypothetical protein